MLSQFLVMPCAGNQQQKNYYWGMGLTTILCQVQPAAVACKNCNTWRFHIFISKESIFHFKFFSIFFFCSFVIFPLSLLFIFNFFRLLQLQDLQVQAQLLRNTVRVTETNSIKYFPAWKYNGGQNARQSCF